MNIIICLSLVFFSTSIFSQDERFIRDLFSGKLKTSETQEIPDAKFHVASPFYGIDITGDRRKEFVVYEKRDGQDWFHLHNSRKERIFSYRLDTKGSDAKLYRIQRRKISPITTVLFLHFYEGHTRSINFHGSSRLYFLTIDNNDLESLSMYKGPTFWDETEVANQGYWRRQYNMGLKDLSGDHFKEVIISQGPIKRVFKYMLEGNWQEIK